MKADANTWMTELGFKVLQPYTLLIPRARALAKDLDIIAFDGTEEIGCPHSFTLRLTHPQANLSRTRFVGMPAAFVIAPPALPGLPPMGTGRKIQGVITGWNQIDSNNDVTTYEAILESQLALLRNASHSRLFLEQTFPQIIDTILREHDFLTHTARFQFKLRREYEQRPIVTQWEETDLSFIQRLCKRSGIWFRIDVNEHGEENVVFGDDFTHYRRGPGLSAPLRPDSGLESAGNVSVQSLETHTKSIVRSILVSDYNRFNAPYPVQAEINLARNDTTTYGQAYVYGIGHLDKQQAEWEAQLRHEAALCEQVIYHGKSNVLDLSPGAVFKLSNVVLPDAEYGQLITKVTHHGARDTAYHNTYTAIPSDRIYRLPLEEHTWPKIHGTVSARITSPDKYPHAYLNADGDYVVQFDFDLDPRKAGLNSCRMRLAKPFAGSLQTGFHFPLIDGTGVEVCYRNGDPDAPYIAHAMHDSWNPDVITSHARWISRNQIRTQSNNKLRMEDWQGEEHVKLATEFGKSQLNLGHLVDHKRKQRGAGAELRTDEHLSLRGGKGIFVSADAQIKANGLQLDMHAALGQMNVILAQMESLNSAAKLAQAEIADLREENQWLQNSVKDLKESALLLSAPAGISATTPGRMHLSGGRGLHINSGTNADIGVMRNLAVAAGQCLSLFAQKLGIKIFAASGKVQIQAQSDAMELVSSKDMTLTSADGMQHFSSARGIVLSSGGAFIKIKDGNVEVGGPGKLLLHNLGMEHVGVSTLSDNMPKFAKVDGAADEKFVIANGTSGIPLPNRPYQIEFEDGRIVKGITDAAGKTAVDLSAVTQGMKLILPKK